MATIPKPPQTDHLDALHEALETARREVVDLCEKLVDTALLATWQITPTMQAWQQAAEAWNDAVADAAVDVRVFMEEHTEQWLAAARGEAYEAFAGALEGAQVETEPSNTLRLTLTIDLADGQVEGTVENADEVLPETPDIPELDA